MVGGGGGSRSGDVKSGNIKKGPLLQRAGEVWQVLKGALERGVCIVVLFCWMFGTSGRGPALSRFCDWEHGTWHPSSGCWVSHPWR